MERFLLCRVLRVTFVCVCVCLCGLQFNHTRKEPTRGPPFAMCRLYGLFVMFLS